MSSGHIYAPQTSGILTHCLKKVDIKEKPSCEHEQEIEKMKKEIDERRVEINRLKSSLDAAKIELSKEKAHVEESKSKGSDQRESFTSSFIDAMQQEMQQQITTEKDMKEKYKQRLDTMVTEMTQVGMYFVVTNAIIIHNTP